MSSLFCWTKRRVWKKNSLNLYEILIMKNYVITLIRGNYGTSGRQICLLISFSSMIHSPQVSSQESKNFKHLIAIDWKNWIAFLIFKFGKNLELISTFLYQSKKNNSDWVQFQGLYRVIWFSWTLWMVFGWSAKP